jgi:predicted lipoprotein with Yx(FWY)xxD motif
VISIPIARPRGSRRGGRIVAYWPLALCLLLLSCGGGGGEAGTAAAGSATVNTLDVPGYGTVLASKTGQPLYLLTADPSGGSACSGECTQAWPPLIEDGALTAAPGVKSSLLAAFDRDDGGKQVLYNRQALYTHAGEGLVAGAGAEAHGGTWYLVSPDGEAIEMTESGGY